MLKWKKDDITYNRYKFSWNLTDRWLSHWWSERRGISIDASVSLICKVSWRRLDGLTVFLGEALGGGDFCFHLKWVLGFSSSSSSSSSSGAASTTTSWACSLPISSKRGLAATEVTPNLGQEFFHAWHPDSLPIFLLFCLPPQASCDQFDSSIIEFVWRWTRIGYFIPLVIPKLVRRLEVRCGMQNRVPVHPWWNASKPWHHQLDYICTRVEGWGYQRTVDRNQTVGQSDWASMAPGGKHPRTGTLGGKAWCWQPLECTISKRRSIVSNILKPYPVPGIYGKHRNKLYKS